MPGKQATLVELTDLQREILERIFSRRKTPQQLAIRAKIIYFADEGFNNPQIAEELPINRDTVSRWRCKWAKHKDVLREIEKSGEEKKIVEAIVEVLSDAPRSGRPSEFTPEQLVQIIAIACEATEESGRPISHWSQVEIADEAKKRGIVESISQQTISRFLKRGRLKTS